MSTFRNKATLSYNGNLIDSNTITGELVTVLSVTKHAVIDSYEKGDHITYVISIINVGTTPYLDLTVTDNLGAYTVEPLTLVPLTYVDQSAKCFINGRLQDTLDVTAGDTLVFTEIQVPAGGNTTLIYHAQVNEYAPLLTASEITNEVVISGLELSTPIKATGVIQTLDEPNLTISKSVCPLVVTENGEVTYTFTIQNTGNTSAAPEDKITLSDTFKPALNPIAVSFNGTSWTSPTHYIYDPDTGIFTTNEGEITVEAAQLEPDSVDGKWTVVPGVSTLIVTGTI